MPICLITVPAMVDRRLQPPLVVCTYPTTLEEPLPDVVEVDVDFVEVEVVGAEVVFVVDPVSLEFTSFTQSSRT